MKNFASSTVVAFTVLASALATDEAIAKNEVKFRNCTAHSIWVKSYNEWDSSMSMVYQFGNGSEIIVGRNNILAKNAGKGETSTLECDDSYWFKSYDKCKIVITCTSGYSCSKTSDSFEEGDWLYYSSDEIEQGSECAYFND